MLVFPAIRPWLKELDVSGCNNGMKNWICSQLEILGNDELGDPIVLYDAQAERFILTSMGNSAVNFAITEGSNPYTDGWYVYTAADDTFTYNETTEWFEQPDGTYADDKSSDPK